MTRIWGVLNATPDSFSDRIRLTSLDAAIAHARRLIAEGADVVDVGGESTRPGAERVPVAEEQRRVIALIEHLAAEGMTISIDTMNAVTATAAVQAGARYVNDVSGGLADPDMLAAVAATNAEYVIGHWRGPSADMYARAEYQRIGTEVAAELGDRVGAATQAGIDRARIVVDPGIGFAKTGEQNWELLRHLSDVTALGFRVLIGTSRKRFLRDALQLRMPDERYEFERHASAVAELDHATALTSAYAADAGAWAVRVHDVATTRDALRVRAAWRGDADG